MKKWIRLTSCIAIVLTCLSVSGAEDASLRARVEELYQRNTQAIEAKDIDALMSQFTEEYVAIGSGLDKKKLRKIVEKQLFSQFEEFDVNTVIQQIDPMDSEIRVICKCTMKAKKKSDSEWKTIDEDTLIEFLKEEEGELKFHVSTKADLERLENIQNQTYTDQELGYSITMPEGWTILPGKHPRLQDFLAGRSADGNSFFAFGYIEMPYNVGAKEAIEGDAAAQKRMIGDGFEILQTGPTTIGEFDAYEAIAKINEEDSTNQRWSVYMSTGGLLYTFFFNTQPADQFEQAKPQFQSILNSFSLSSEAKDDGITRERARRAQGEITGQIYTNDELGCQIAAPAGWSLESTNIGEMLSINMKPETGDSLARFVVTKTGGLFTLNQAFEGELKGIKALTADFSSEATQEIKVGSVEGQSCIYQFTLEGLGTVKRKSAMFLENDVLYLFVCDAKPPSEFESLEPKFDQIIQSFTLN